MELKDKHGLTEAEFLKDYQTQTYPKPSVTADIVVIATEASRRRVLLIQRGGHPFLGQWALPGGFAEPGETLEQSAARELEEETCLTGIPMTLVCIASKPGRDPRGWTVSAVYRACVDAGALKPMASDDASATAWFLIDDHSPNEIRLTSGDFALQIPLCADGSVAEGDNRGPNRLAFDHGEILVKALGKA